MQRNNRCDVVFVACFQNFSVVIDFCLRELSVLWLDATPFNTES